MEQGFADAMKFIAHGRRSKKMADQVAKGIGKMAQLMRRILVDGERRIIRWRKPLAQRGKKWQHD
jgi:hypothetical protein